VLADHPEVACRRNDWLDWRPTGGPCWPDQDTTGCGFFNSSCQGWSQPTPPSPLLLPRHRGQPSLPRWRPASRQLRGECGAPGTGLYQLRARASGGRPPLILATHYREGADSPLGLGDPAPPETPPPPYNLLCSAVSGPDRFGRRQEHCAASAFNALGFAVICC